MRLPLLATLLLLLASPGWAKPVPRGRPAPAFNLPGPTRPVISDSLRGRVVLIDFWASWCEPCRKSFPWMSGLYRRHSADGFAIVAINLDKARDGADAFLARHPVPFTIAFDPGGTTAEAFRVSAMPTSYLVGRDGTILYSHAGFDPHKAEVLEGMIAEACKR